MKKPALLAALAATLLLCLLSVPAFSAGFAMYEFSARGNAVGGAVVANPKDASTMATNIAGMTQLDGGHVLAGATIIQPHQDVETPEGDFRGQSPNWVPPHAYYTQQVTDRLWMGLGVFTRYGLSAEFDPEWPGRYNSYFAQIVSSSVVPGIAYKLTDTLSLGLGLEAMYFDFKQQKKVRTAPGDVDGTLHGDSLGVGFNVSAHYHPIQPLRIGLAYRSLVEQRVTGRASFNNPAGLPPIFFQDTDAWGTIRLPDSVQAGVSYDILDNLTVEADVIWTRWSSYRNLTINYDKALMPTNPASTSTMSEKNYKDVFRYCLGVEYGVLPWLDLRAGYVYDESPVRDSYADYLVPANDRQIFSLGTGIKYDNWNFDVSYSYLWIMGRDVDARPEDGVVDSNFKNGDAHMVGFSVGYKF
ncbi:MAG: OmpP1/FadL family transporter [Desulfovibrio sp.]|uniref:OmpP1/FadL family transporter n=1 Tax=Desulfovibrio sp. 7SRBS1 TaxID=3378064 RepID=UPI003B3E718D